MPEFILDLGTGHAAFRQLDAFTRGYIECMFFTSTGTGDDDDLENASVDELAPESLVDIVADCAKFQAENVDDLAKYRDEYKNPRDWDLDECAGHDFWYTRNHHGVGYWDRGLSEDLSDRLTKAAQSWREIDMYRGDDGKIYLG